MRRRFIAGLIGVAALASAGIARAEDDLTPAAGGGRVEAAAPPAPVGRVAETAPPAAAAGRAASAGDDPAPAEATPDPLTPKVEDAGPAAAPGAPARATATSPGASSAPEPLLAAVRSRLADWPAGAGKDEAADLAALKAAYAESDARVVWTTPSGFTDRARSAIATLERADEHGLDAAAFAVPAEPAGGAAADALAQTEIRLALAVLKYARHARGGRIDPPALSRMIDMRPRLYEPRSLLDAVAVAPDAGAYLDGLNPRHDGYRALKAALAEMRAKAGKDEEAASSPPLPRRKAGDGEMRIVANMERWRWLPDDLGAFHVWDNVPEQVTRVFHDGKVVLKERIVVGKPSTPTPMFSAPMRFVIFQPSWGVPEGIKTNELAPMLRRAQANASGWFFSQNDGASRALRRHELRVFHGGREVNPDSINWASVDVRQFQFTQPPSAKNVLGVVKFRFPNRFDVYMHDTSERHLFSRSQRTFSHGCMRVENPLRFAETILAYDKGWGRERIAALAARSDTTDVTLDKSVPVHIVYFTAVAEPDGKLHTHPDVYGMDSRVASALAGRSVSLASARDEVEKPAPVQRPARREQKPQRGSAERSPPPRPFNPFSGLTGN